MSGIGYYTRSKSNFDEINLNDIEIPWNSWKQNFTIFTVYKRRWFILGVVSLLNFVNGMISTQFKPLVNETNSYFCPDSGTDCSLGLILDLVLLVGFILCAYPSIWICSRLKIRYSLFVGIFFLLLTSILKILATWDSFSSITKYVLLISGHALSVPSQIIGLNIVPLISHLWFPVGQRTFATGLEIYAFFFGYLSSFLTSPELYKIRIFGQYLNESETIVKSEKFLYLNMIPLLLSVILLVLIYFIRDSTPKKPPSASASVQLFKDNRKFLARPAFLGQILIFGLAFGAFKFLTASYGDYLCLNGYILDFNVYFPLLVLVGSLAGVFLFSIIVDHFQEYKRTYRSCFAIMAASTCLLGWAVLAPDETFFVLLSLGVFGIFGMATIFIGVEMAIETVYPANQATTSGILFTSGNAFHLLFIGMKYASRRHLHELEYKNQTCHDKNVKEFIDYTTSPCLVGLVLIIGAILMLVCLQVKTRRKDYENNAKLMKISVFSMENPSFTGKLSQSSEF